MRFDEKTYLEKNPFTGQKLGKQEYKKTSEMSCSSYSRKKMFTAAFVGVGIEKEPVL